METNKSSRNKIIWAMDPTQNPKYATNLIKELRIWSEHLGCGVQPVSIFSKTILNFPVEVVLPWNPKIEQIAKDSVNKYIKETQTSDFLKPEIVFTPTASTRSLTSALVRFAERKNGFLIFANTRAKKTWNPFHIGGFAETLIATSQVPVLLMNSSAKSSKKVSSVLLPTNFDIDSKKTLKHIIPWLKSFDAKVLIYNQIETPYIYPADFNENMNILALESIFKNVENLRDKKAKVWLDILSSENLLGTKVIQQQEKKLDSAIIDMAKKNKSDLIVLNSVGGQLSQFLIGSIARDVLLQAHCPVLIFHKTKLHKNKTVVQEEAFIGKTNTKIPIKVVEEAYT